MDENLAIDTHSNIINGSFLRPCLKSVCPENAAVQQCLNSNIQMCFILKYGVISSRNRHLFHRFYFVLCGATCSYVITDQRREKAFLFKYLMLNKYRS